MAEATMPPVMRSDRRANHDKAHKLTERYEVLKRQRLQWEFDWQEIVRYIAPGSDDIIELREPGQSRTEYIYDSHPLRAPRILTANMMGAVTNQSMTWRQLKFREKELNETQAVSQWLQAYDIAVMADYAASNFYQAAQTFYYNLANFGTACMYESSRLGSDGMHLHFKTLPTGAYCIAENADGFVDTVYRDLWLTARQAMQMFEGEVSTEVQELARQESKKDEVRLFVHAVYPRTDRNPERWDNRNMPFASCYFEKDTHFLNEESGYQEFPFLTSRWETLSKSPYGFGPGHLALPDVRMLNMLREMNIQMLSLWVQPPLQVLQEAIMGNVSLESRAMNLVTQQDAIRTLDLTGRPDLVQLDQADLRRSIDDTYYVSALQALPPPDASNMTAYEVAQRIELMTRTMGPVFYRLLAEFLTPLEDRTFGLKWRYAASVNWQAGMPAPPLEMLRAASRNQGQLDVEFDGPLARAQRGEEVRALRDLIALNTAIAEAQQSLAIWDNYDWDTAIRDIGKVLGVPGAYLIDYQKVVRKRQAQQAQAQAMQQAQMGNERMQSLGSIAPLVTAMGGAGGGQEALAA